MLAAMKSRLVRRLLLVLAFSPALLPLWQILHFGVDVPYWDQFDDDLAGMHIRAHAGELTFGDLAAQHNEHRILVPRLVFLALGHATHGNIVAEMLAGWAIVVATSLVLLRLGGARQSETGGEGEWRRPVFWWFLANLLIFSPAQYENWLWGIGVANVLPMLWTALAIAAAASSLRTALKVALVVAFAALATWSSGNGMLAWGLAGGVLLWAPTWRELRNRWPLALLLVAIGGLVAAVYFSGMAPPNHRGLRPYDSTLAGKLHYALVFAGSPFAFALATPPVVVATGLGAACYALLAVCAARFLQLWRRGGEPELCRRVLPWFAVAGFAVGSGLIAACARAGIGPSQGASSRYVTFAVYLPVALIPLLLQLKPWRAMARRFGDGAAGAVRQDALVPAAGATTLVVLSLAAVAPALHSSAETQAARRQTRLGVQLAGILPTHPMLPTLVFPDAAVAHRNAVGLDAIGYLRPRVIRSREVRLLAAPQPSPAEATGQLERVWEIAPGELALSGWAVLPETQRPADAVLVCVDDERGEPLITEVAAVRIPRTDLASKGVEAASSCGWALRTPAEVIMRRSGAIAVSAWAFDTEKGEAYPLAGSATLGR